MAELQLQWLGPPAAKLNGQPLRLEMRKTLALLAYLSLSPQPPTRETLSALFWPEFDQQHALSNLRRNLSSLSNSLPPGLLEADRERIGLRAGDEVRVDVEEYQRLLAKVKSHTHPADQACGECRQILERAVKMYRGDFFEGFNLKDCRDFDDWQFFQREGLRAEYAGALEQLAGCYQQSGDWEQAITYCRAWLALDRCHEPAQRKLMQIYFLAGQKSAALRQYEECERTLNQELGQPPEPETLELYQEIRKEAPPEAQHEQPALKIKAPAGSPEIALTRTKFFLPRVPRTIIHRPRLVAQLDQCVRMPLTLISASAGFGKTTLLAEWAEQAQDLIAWVSLDRSDNDPYRLVDYIVNAIRNILPGAKVGAAALNLLHASQPVQIPVIVGSLINDLVSIPDALVLVLDDYHNIDSPAAHEVLNFMLDHQPENLHIVISTRSDPALPLARLRANIQLSDIRMDDLRFTDDETQLFLTRAIGFPLSAQDMAFFGNKIEGWIAGIQMAALVMQSNNLSQSSAGLQSFIRTFRGGQRFVLDYLIEEVLNRQPQEIRTFLLRTSILEKLCYPLCDSLLAGDGLDENQQINKPELAEKKSSQHILEYLDRSNLFLIPLDDERNWYRYHHLFADLLHARLQQHEPRLEAGLHKRAANWYTQNSYPMEAVKHALDSGDYSYAADLIEEYSLRLMWMNRIVTTLDWFKSLPAEVLESHPLLMIYQTFMLARRGEFERVESMLANAEAYIKTIPGSPKIDEYTILILGMRAFVANLKGDPEKAIQYISAISPITLDQHINCFIMTRAQLAVAYLDSGDISSAEQVFTKIVEWAQENQDVYYSVLTNKELAEIWNLRGCPSRAEQLYKQMYDWIQQTVQEPALYGGLIKVYEASLLIEKNELEMAGLLMQEEVESLLSVWNTTSLYMGHMVMAYLHTALRDFQRARVEVEKALHWVTSQNLYPRNKSMVQACQVNLWLAEGSLAEAQNWAQANFPLMPADLPFIRELDALCLARIWVASQRWEEALDLLKHLSHAAELGKRFGRLLKINILQALTLNGLGRFEKALDVLENCLEFAFPEGYMRIFLDEGAPMKALLQRGKKERRWQDPKIRDYAGKLLEAF